ncbi:MAG: TIGR00341 family protein [Chloroflexota bacterium]
MKIIEGSLPQRAAWRVLIPITPGERLNRTWELGLELARANEGDLITAVIIPDASEQHIIRARNAIDTITQHTPLSSDLHGLIVVAANYTQGLRQLADEANIDLALAHADGLIRQNLSGLPCTVAVSRGDRIDPTAAPGNSEQPAIARILVPTSAGPNVVHALAFLLPLTQKIEVTALYVAQEDLGSPEVALGQSHLRRVLNQLDATSHIQTKIITADSVPEAIAAEADQGYDLVILGSSRESSLDHALFGNLPKAVIEQAKIPVLVVRQPQQRLNNLYERFAWWFRSLIPRMELDERTDAYMRIRRSSRAATYYYVLIALSTLIAALGLTINSPAVVIGAMLVAPLMSPIVGTGLAIVLGDAKFVRMALGSVVRGVLLAIFLGAIIGLIYPNETLTSELLARTEPSLFDLGIALFSGIAGAYALSRSNAAGALPGVAIAAALVPPLATVGISLTTQHWQQAFGALLLFATNFVAISSATALTFLLLGFSPMPTQKERRTIQARSVRMALILLAFISILLFAFTYQLAQQTAQETEIRNTIIDNVAMITNAEIVNETEDLIIEGDLLDSAEPLQLDITARSPQTVSHARVVELQDQISADLQREVELTFTVIRVTQLDPVIPPTQTITPTVTETPTPGPTPTSTLQPTATNTAVPTNTPMPTATATIVEPTATNFPASATPTVEPTSTATATPTATATVPTAVINAPFGLNMRATPSTTAPIITRLDNQTVVVLLSGRETSDEITWQEILFNGDVGWVSAEFLAQP